MRFWCKAVDQVIPYNEMKIKEAMMSGRHILILSIIRFMMALSKTLISVGKIMQPRSVTFGALLGMAIAAMVFKHQSVPAFTVLARMPSTKTGKVYAP